MEFRALADDAAGILEKDSWHGRLARVYAHWRALRDGKQLPAHDQLELGALAPDLRYLATLRVRGPELVFTSVGEEIAERYGRKLTGSHLADLFVGLAQLDMIAAHRACAELRLPILSQLDLAEVDMSNRVPFQRLLLPFSDDGGQIDHIVWVMAFPA